jgi:hypothetical protein
MSYRWPDGLLEEIPPLEEVEKYELCRLLRADCDAGRKVEKWINLSFIWLSEDIARHNSRKSHAHAKKEADPLARLLASDAALGKLAESQGKSKDEVVNDIRRAGHALVNEGVDARVNSALHTFACYVIGCADDILGEKAWTIPAPENLENAERGVVVFAERALEIACDHIRRAVIPKANEEEIIGKLEQTSRRSISEAILRWRDVTLADAVGKLKTRISQKR